MTPMRKVLDQTFDLSEDGLAASYRIRLFEPCSDLGKESTEPLDTERVLVVSWEIHPPGIFLDQWIEQDKWIEQMAEESFKILHEQGGQVLLVEFYPKREYHTEDSVLVFDEEITTAQVLPQKDGTLALLDFGEMPRKEIEARIGESLTETTVQETPV